MKSLYFFFNPVESMLATTELLNEKWKWQKMQEPNKPRKLSAYVTINFSRTTRKANIKKCPANLVKRQVNQRMFERWLMEYYSLYISIYLCVCKVFKKISMWMLNNMLKDVLHLFCTCSYTNCSFARIQHSKKI